MLLTEKNTRTSRRKKGAGAVAIDGARSAKTGADMCAQKNKLKTRRGHERGESKRSRGG